MARGQPLGSPTGLPSPSDPWRAVCPSRQAMQALRAGPVSVAGCRSPLLWGVAAARAGREEPRPRSRPGRASLQASAGRLEVQADGIQGETAHIADRCLLTGGETTRQGCLRGAAFRRRAGPGSPARGSRPVRSSADRRARRQARVARNSHPSRLTRSLAGAADAGQHSQAARGPRSARPPPGRVRPHRRRRPLRKGTKLCEPVSAMSRLPRQDAALLGRACIQRGANPRRRHQDQDGPDRRRLVGGGEAQHGPRTRQRKGRGSIPHPDRRTGTARKPAAHQRGPSAGARTLVGLQLAWPADWPAAGDARAGLCIRAG